MPSRTRALFAFPFAALALAAAHPSYAAQHRRRRSPSRRRPGAVSESLPVFGWTKVANADRYEFQVAADNGFNSPVIGSGEDHFVTKNTRATLKRTIPNGTYYWRVRAITKAGGVSPWTTPQQFKKTWTAAATLQAPAAGVGLSFPANPLSLSWSGVPCAASYLVAVATDPSLGSLVLHDAGSTSAVSTAATTLTSPSVFAPGTYYWAVTPVDARGNKGASSSVAAFSWGWPSASTPAVQDVVAATEVYDPQFSWTGVSGAARYEVEVNPTPDFVPGSKVCCTGTTIATTLSPTVVLKDNTYYWRVRAIDADGNAGVWNVGPSFTKTFDKVPPVTAPSIKNLRMVDTSDTAQTAGPAYTTTVPIIRWDPVPGASSYQVDVAPFQVGSCNWSSSSAPPERWNSVTATTAWTPLGYQWNSIKPYSDAHAVATDQANLIAGHSYCARVRARSDRDSTSSDVYGDYTYLAGGGQAFTWSGPPTADPCAAPCNPAASDYLLPQTGTSTTRMPFFTWKPLQGRASYFVLVSKDASFSNIVDYAFTQLPAYAPRGQSVTTYPDEATFYYWAVLPATNANGNGVDTGPLTANPQSFIKLSTPPAVVAPAEASTITGQPTFQWTSAEAARNYRIQVSQDSSFGNTLEDTTTDSTTYTPNTTYPADTVLYWRVRANDENQVGLSWSPTATFRRTLPAPVPSPTNPTDRRPDPHMVLGARARSGLVRRLGRPVGRDAQGPQRDPHAGAHRHDHDRHRALPLARARQLPEGRRGQRRARAVLGRRHVHAHDRRAGGRALRAGEGPRRALVGAEGGREGVPRPGVADAGLRHGRRRHPHRQHELRAAAHRRGLRQRRHALLARRRRRRRPQPGRLLAGAEDRLRQEDARLPHALPDARAEVGGGREGRRRDEQARGGRGSPGDRKGPQGGRPAHEPRRLDHLQAAGAQGRLDRVPRRQDRLRPGELHLQRQVALRKIGGPAAVL